MENCFSVSENPTQTSVLGHPGGDHDTGVWVGCLFRATVVYVDQSLAASAAR